MRNYTPKRAASARSHTPSRPNTHPVRVPALTKPVPRSAFQGNSAGRRPDRRTDRQTDRTERPRRRGEGAATYSRGPPSSRGAAGGGCGSPSSRQRPLPPRSPGRQPTIAARGATPAAAGRGAEGAARTGPASPRLASAGARRRRAPRGLGPRPGEAVPSSGCSPRRGGGSGPVPPGPKTEAVWGLGSAGTGGAAGGSGWLQPTHVQTHTEV